MIILLKIAYLILEIFTYLLVPFANLSVKLFELGEKHQNKIVYYLILIPQYLILPFSLLWIELKLWQLNIQEKIKFKKQYRYEK